MSLVVLVLLVFLTGVVLKWNTLSKDLSGISPFQQAVAELSIFQDGEASDWTSDWCKQTPLKNWPHFEFPPENFLELLFNCFEMVFLMTYIDSVMKCYPFCYFFTIQHENLFFRAQIFSNVISSLSGVGSGVGENRRLRRVLGFLSDLQTVQRKDSGWRRRSISGGRVQGRNDFPASALI